MPGNERANTRPYWQKEGRPGSPAIDKAMPQAVQFITDMLCVSPKDRPFWSAGKRQTRRKKSLLRQRSRFLGAETAAVLCPLQRSIRIRQPGAEASGARIHGPYPTEKNLLLQNGGPFLPVRQGHMAGALLRRTYWKQPREKTGIEAIQQFHPFVRLHPYEGCGAAERSYGRIIYE